MKTHTHTHTYTRPPAQRWHILTGALPKEDTSWQCRKNTHTCTHTQGPLPNNDSLWICSMKLCSCKLSTGTNEVLLCSASVSVRNVVGCWECLPFYKEKDATYTATLLLRMSYYSNYSCKWPGMLSCKQQLHGWNCLASIASVCVLCVLSGRMCVVLWCEQNWWVGDKVAIVGYLSIW